MILELIFSFLLGMFIASYIFYKRRNEMMWMMARVESMLEKKNSPTIRNDKVPDMLDKQSKKTNKPNDKKPTEIEAQFNKIENDRPKVM